jgi:DNA-directed RNA polymerase subunit K/omega
MADDEKFPEALAEEYDEYEDEVESEIETDDEKYEGEEAKDLLEEYHEDASAAQVLAPEVFKLHPEDQNHRLVVVIKDDQRMTSNIIQLPELVEAVGIRASQIEQGSEVFTDVTGLTDPVAQAKKEFIDRRNPLILERGVKKTKGAIYVEWWKVRDMTFPILTREIQSLTIKQRAELKI